MLRLVVGRAAWARPQILNATHAPAPGALLSCAQVNFLSHWLLAHLLLEHERGRRSKGQEQQRTRQQVWGQGKSEPKPEAVAKPQGSQAAAGVSGGASGASSCVSCCGPADCTRVVVVSSVVHRAGPLLWHDMLSKDRCGGWGMSGGWPLMEGGDS